MPHSAENAAVPDFEAWLESNNNDLWAEFHETGAYYEMDYGDWLEQRYDQSVLKNEGVQT